MVVPITHTHKHTHGSEQKDGDFGHLGLPMGSGHVALSQSPTHDDEQQERQQHDKSREHGFNNPRDGKA